MAMMPPKEILTEVGQILLYMTPYIAFNCLVLIFPPKFCVKLSSDPQTNFFILFFFLYKSASKYKLTRN